ncbi:MAG: glucose-6-phosphate dehydrogenase [Gemmatimonadota bacterium]
MTSDSSPIASPPGSGARGSELPGLSVRVGQTDGSVEPRPADPCVMIIFGASGDLTRKQLLPSLFELHCNGFLPEEFAVVGSARKAWSAQRFREVAREAVRGGECAWDAGAFGRFAERLFYRQADFRSPAEEAYAALGREVESVRTRLGIPDNIFFHLAVPPRFFEPIVEGLAESGLARSDRGWRRLVVEKPFGQDRRSAVALDAALRRIFGEEQIYRIDHFLGKETVQNMLAFRFANPSFEPIWNRNYIDHVQITVAESIGIGTRAGFYEETGVVRDMVQNHLLQLLCMTAIEPPVRFEASSLRDETVKVLQAVKVEPPDVDRGLVLGQYGPGAISGEGVRGYREEEGVEPTSTTPTFCALRLTLDSWRWADVPFYLRTGKRLSSKLTEVAIHFKPTPHVMFPGEEYRRRANLLCFRLQPDEGIVEEFFAKRPGPDMHLQPVRMEFDYARAFGVEEPPRAYAWLLLDVMQGDQTLFARADWIQEAWKIVDPIVEGTGTGAGGKVEIYPAGSAGPSAASELMAGDGRTWRRL